MTITIKQFDRETRGARRGAAFPAGTVLVGMIQAAHPRELLLRAYSAVISLENPGRTWGLDVPIMDAEEVDIEITVKPR